MPVSAMLGFNYLKTSFEYNALYALFCVHWLYKNRKRNSKMREIRTVYSVSSSCLL